jgi:hypothetical protein
MGIEHADAIGAEQTDAMFTRDVKTLLLQPTSRNPAETMIAALMPRLAQSSMAFGVACVGRIRIARSTGSGTSCTFV